MKVNGTDGLFIAIGLLIVGLGLFMGSAGTENGTMEMIMVAFGGAVIGSSVTLMSARRNKKIGIRNNGKKS